MELWQINRLKSNRFSFLHRNLDCTKVAITDFDTDSTQSSNLMICVATGFVSPVNVSIERSTVLEEDSLEKLCILILALNFWCPKAYWRFCFELNRLSKSNFSVNRAVIFSIAVWIEKIRFWTDFKVEKMSNFLLATATWWRKMFQKVLWILIYLDIQTPLSRKFQVRFVASRFQ